MSLSPDSDVQTVVARMVEVKYEYIDLKPSDHSKAATDLYIAAAIYLGFTVISLFFWIRGNKKVKRYYHLDEHTPLYSPLHTQ